MTSPPASGNHASSQSPSALPAPAPLPPQHVVRRTRMGGWWVASALFALVLLLLLIFILGVLLVVIPGTGRIIQLRMLARRHHKTDANSIASSQLVPATQQADPEPNPS